MWSFRPLSIAMIKIIRLICPVPLQDALYGENTDNYFGGFCSGLAYYAKDPRTWVKRVQRAPYNAIGKQVSSYISVYL